MNRRTPPWLKKAAYIGAIVGALAFAAALHLIYGGAR